MAETVSIRLAAEDREVLTRAASRRGIGISAFLRELAHDEATRLRRARTRQQGERFMAEFHGNPALQAELDELATPQAAHPDGEAWWPAP